jgi:manganese/zinc/iron transport system permease protein
MNLFEAIQLMFTDYTVQTVAIGAAILGLVSGALGSFTVLRRQSLLGDVMSHAALPGVMLAFILTRERDLLPLLLGASVACWLAALFMMLVTSRTRIKQDSAMGIVLAVFFAVGVVALAWIQSNVPGSQKGGLDRFIFGRAAALTRSDVEVMVWIGLGTLGLVVAFWKEFKLLSFDPGFAVSLGFNVRLLDILLTTLVVAAIVVGLQAVGVILMSAMLVAPGAAARQWTNRLLTMVILSGAFGALAGVVGTLISTTERRIPTGPTIVLCISVIVLFSLLFAPNRGLIWERIRRWRNRRRLQQMRRAPIREESYAASTD